jgi:hypothetical protein
LFYYICYIIKNKQKDLYSPKHDTYICSIHIYVQGVFYETPTLFTPHIGQGRTAREERQGYPSMEYGRQKRWRVNPRGEREAEWILEGWVVQKRDFYNAKHIG